MTWDSPKSPRDDFKINQPNIWSMMNFVINIIDSILNLLMLEKKLGEQHIS